MFAIRTGVALIVAISVVACSDSNQNPTGPGSMTGETASHDISWCFVHDRSVSITLENTKTGIDVFFTTGSPGVVDYLRSGVYAMVIGTSMNRFERLRPLGRNPESGDDGSAGGHWKDVVVFCHKGIQTELLPKLQMKFTAVDGGACVSFTPVDPMDRELTCSMVRGYFYGLNTRSCASL
jgi:hypothetical protein